MQNNDDGSNWDVATMDFWTMIVTALGIGIALVIVAFFAGLAYMIWHTAVKSTHKEK